MSADNGPGTATGQDAGPQEPVVKGRRRLSAIWLIPAVVAVVAGTLAYRAILDRGPQVVVVFESAEGLKAGKSKVQYREVEVGSVDEVKVRDLEHVEIHVSLDPRLHPFVTQDMAWWVVRPRMSGGVISGLQTIVSGAYLTFEPGSKGKPQTREFTGLEEPPIPASNRPGLDLVLHTDEVGGLQAGSHLYFRDIEVGDVLHYALAQDGKSVEVQVIVEDAYARWVTSHSRFWNAGGVDVSVGAEGLDVKTESLASIVGGGIAFDSPAGGEPAKDGDVFWLHSSRADVAQSESTHGGLGLVLETGSLGGVSLGNPVYYRELPVGAVVSHGLAKDGRTVQVRVNVERRYESLVRSNTVFWNASGISADLGLSGLHVHAESLKSLRSGGVGFATPPEPGLPVEDGSVFELHPEVKQKWLEWQPDFSAGKPASPGEPHAGASFFHHEGKTEAQAAEAAAEPQPGAQKHGFLRRLFGGHDGSAKPK